MESKMLSTRHHVSSLLRMHTIRKLATTLNKLTFVRSLSTNVNTVSPSEIALFSRLSNQWWDEHGEFAMLHRMNPPRMDFIRQKLEEVQMDEADSFTTQRSTRPLQGLDVLDVGCGGGLLSEVCFSFVQLR
jgi:polyprenyldihydroxybenzoate methyltransferase / 3-demethylubiquinol 3-O-methyltransferase